MNPFSHPSDEDFRGLMDEMTSALISTARSDSRKVTELREVRRLLKRKIVNGSKERMIFAVTNRAKLDTTSRTKQQGLKRLILPEHNRPFIQKLSAVAGKIALTDLKNMT